MTYPSPDPRDPVPPRERYRSDEGMGGGTIVAIVVAAVLALGALLWMFNSGDRSTASNPSPTTTGQKTETPRPGSEPQSNPGPSDRTPTTAPKAQ